MLQADQYYGGRDVKKIMDTWTLNMGFPLVTFDRLDRTRVNISQKHFLIDPDSPVDPDGRYGDIGLIKTLCSLKIDHKELEISMSL